MNVWEFLTTNLILDLSIISWAMRMGSRRALRRQ